MSITTIHYNMKHEITSSNIHLLTLIRCYLLLLEVISIIDNFKLGLPFYGSDEGQVGLEKAPLFKVGNDRKSLRTTGLINSPKHPDPDPHVTKHLHHSGRPQKTSGP